MRGGAYDVIVVGLGAMGSAAARSLAARGARVLGLEQFGPAHALGASHGGSRIIRLAYYEDPSYVPLLRTAYELWARLEDASGRQLVSQCGALFLGPPDGEVFGGTLRAAREHGLDHEVLDAGEVRRRYEVLRPDDSMLGVHEDIAGIVSPEVGVQAHLDVAARAGADLRFDTPITSWTADGSGVAVETAAGALRAQRLILTPGAWAPDLLGRPDLPLHVERRLQLWFAPAARQTAFAALPVWMWERADGLIFYGLPLRDGAAKVAIHDRGEPCHPDTVERAVDPAEVAQMRDVLRDAAPDLAAGGYVRGSACTYTLTPDHHFIVGPHPDHPQVSIACGFSGHGFKFAPVIGEVLADLALDGHTDHPIWLFDPVRLLG